MMHWKGEGFFLPLGATGAEHHAQLVPIFPLLMLSNIILEVLAKAMKNRKSYTVWKGRNKTVCRGYDYLCRKIQ